MKEVKTGSEQKAPKFAYPFMSTKSFDAYVKTKGLNQHEADMLGLKSHVSLAIIGGLIPVIISMIIASH